MKVKAAVARAKSCPFGRMASAQVLSTPVITFPPTPDRRKDTIHDCFVMRRKRSSAKRVSSGGVP
jgi:hypothetical protein